MTPTQLKRLEGALESLLESMFSGLGRMERRRAMDWYVKGLLLEGERKSIDPMAGRLVADDEVMRRLALKLEADLPDIESPGAG